MSMPNNAGLPETAAAVPRVERCYAHSGRDAVAFCEPCGRDLCGDCVTVDEGRCYCAIHKPRAARTARRDVLGEGRMTGMHSPRKWLVTVILALVGGVAGLHQFYLGRIVPGLCRAFLVVVALYASHGIEGQFAPGQLKHLFIWPAVAGGLLEFAVDTYVKVAPSRHFQVRFSQTVVNNAPLVAMFVLLAMLFIVMTKWDYASRFHLVLLMAGGGWSGMLLVRDFLLLGRNSLTDGRGRLLA